MDRRLLVRPIHRLAHRLDRLGWWLAEPRSERAMRRRAKEAALAEERERALHIDGPDA